MTNGSPTEITEDAAQETIRKVFVADVALGSALHTVFLAARKDRYRTRAGKEILAIDLVDRTGLLPARVFQNIDAADAAFAAGDYLLVRGKVGAFQRHNQLAIDALERLDPDPIDKADFVYNPPPVVSPEPVAKSSDRLPQRIALLLEDPQAAKALEHLLECLERLRAGQSRKGDLGKSPRRRGERPSRSAPPADRSERPGLGSGVVFKPLSDLPAEPAPTQSPEVEPSPPAT